jgi:hypothetical protein
MLVEALQHGEQLRRPHGGPELLEELTLQSSGRTLAELDGAAKRPPADDGAGVVQNRHDQQLAPAPDNTHAERANMRGRPPDGGHSGFSPQTTPSAAHLRLWLTAASARHVGG